MRRLLCAALLLCCACLLGCDALPTAAKPPATAAPVQTQPLEKSMEQPELSAGDNAPEGAHAEVSVPTEPPAVSAAQPAQGGAAAETATSTAPPAQEEFTMSAPPATGTAPDSFMMQSVPEPYLEFVVAGLDLNISTDVFDIRITHESGELFSCVVEIEEPGGAITKKPFTCRLRDGQPCNLGTFFSDTDTGWKGLLPDLVTEDALQRGMTLLCDVPPVTENQPYYIENGSIVLLYRPYEITTYEAGAPSFRLDMQALAEYTTGAYGIGAKPAPEEVAQPSEAIE